MTIEPRADWGSRNIEDDPAEIRRAHTFRPNPERDTTELEIWLNSLPGHLVAVAPSPWDGGALVAITVEDS